MSKRGPARSSGHTEGGGGRHGRNSWPAAVFDDDLHVVDLGAGIMLDVFINVQGRLTTFISVDGQLVGELPIAGQA